MSHIERGWSNSTASQHGSELIVSEFLCGDTLQCPFRSPEMAVVERGVRIFSLGRCLSILDSNLGIHPIELLGVFVINEPFSESRFRSSPIAQFIHAMGVVKSITFKVRSGLPPLYPKVGDSEY